MTVCASAAAARSWLICGKNRVALPWQPGQFATAPRDLSDLCCSMSRPACGEGEPHRGGDQRRTDFIRRTRLGLEPGWPVTREFARLWDRGFATFRIWQACKRRQLYKENWIEWDELGKARRDRGLPLPRIAAARVERSPGGARRPRLVGDRRTGPCSTHPSCLQRRRAVGDPRAAGHDAKDSPCSGRPEHAGPAVLAGRDRRRAPARPGTLTAAVQHLRGRPSPRRRRQAPQPQSLPLWMESAIRLGTRSCGSRRPGCRRPRSSSSAAAASPDCACCRECGCEHPAVVDEYYFWLINTQVYTNIDDSRRRHGHPGQRRRQLHRQLPVRLPGLLLRPVPAAVGRLE